MDEEKRKRLEQEIVDAKAKAEKAVEFEVRWNALKKEIWDCFNEQDNDNIEEILEDAKYHVHNCETNLVWFLREEQEKLDLAIQKREAEEKINNAINYLIAQGKVLGKDFSIGNAQEIAKQVAIQKKSS